MSSIYQIYVQSRYTGEMTSWRWFPREGEAVAYASDFHFRNPDLLVLVCRETFESARDLQPSRIEPIWKREAR